ncbi:MAG: DUF4340 domain-containing protein [Thermodesulfobacteriota bacterium]
MKIKKEYIILIAVIAALSLYLLLRETDKIRYELPTIPAVAKSDVSKIEITKKGADIHLRKSNDKWTIGPQEYPADPEKVEAMLDIIEELTLTAMVSESRDYTRYQLDDEAKIAVTAWSGDKPAREFDVGKAAPSYHHTFVRLKGDDSVYHARENFRKTFDWGVDDLRDKTVLAFNRADIQEIHLTKNGRSVACVRTISSGSSQQKPAAHGESLPKEQLIWESPEGDRCDEVNLNRLLTLLSKLRCEQYMNTADKQDLADPLYRVELKGAEDYHLSIFPKADEDAKSYPAASSQNKYAFLLPEGQAKSIMKAPEDLLEQTEQKGSQKQKAE